MTTKKIRVEIIVSSGSECHKSCKFFDKILKSHKDDSERCLIYGELATKKFKGVESVLRDDRCIFSEIHNDGQGFNR
jgi:hypothetical protein